MHASYKRYYIIMEHIIITHIDSLNGTMVIYRLFVRDINYSKYFRKGSQIFLLMAWALS